MTITNMKEIAKENNGIIPAGIAMTMTDFEIKKAIQHGYLKEAPEKVHAPEPKKEPKKKSKKSPAGKVAPKKDGQAEEKADLPAPVEEKPASIFSKEQKDAYSRLDGLIYERMNDMKKSSFDIAFALYVIYENGYFKIDGYKNIYDYARERYGIARGTTNNFINLVDRFGDLKTRGVLELKPEFSDYSSTQLICMLGHTDEELKEKNITSSMSSRDIKKALKADVDARGEALNSLNDIKSDLIEGDEADNIDEADSVEEKKLLYNVVLEMTKETFNGFPDFGSADSDTCVLEILAENVKVITKLLLLGHRLQVIEIVD